MKFLLKVKKHQYYLYVSILLMALFFLGNSLITPKIMSVAEDLIDDIVQGNLKSKQNITLFEFNQLNSFLLNSQSILEDEENLSEDKLKSKLLFTSEMAISNNTIDYSFVYILKDNKINYSVFFNNPNETYIKEIEELLTVLNYKENAIVFDEILKSAKNVINRKIVAKKLQNGNVVVAGYDINLIKFWDYFSQTYKGGGGYAVLTNTKGICILHPEPERIGVKLDGFFDEISINEVLEDFENSKNHFVPKKDILIKSKVTSEYLGLEVLRYFKAVKVGNSSIILMVSFPVDIYLKESIVDIKRYFSWISILAFSTFMLMLGISRIQLRKEFFQNLKFAKEKEQLASSNEKYQRENAVLQLNQLKKKMNPHFLFNSLNSLYVLIDLNTEMAQQFVLKLAEVYRYLLEDREGNLITVKKELDFLKQYLFLQEIRFKKSLNLTIKYECDQQSLLKKIPFLALETLVENAIKHNEITKQNPLFIEVIIKNKKIIVINNYNPRKNNKKNSHHIGLNYLKNSYKYYQINSFKTEISDNKYICYLPLLP